MFIGDIREKSLESEVDLSGLRETWRPGEMKPDRFF